MKKQQLAGFHMRKPITGSGLLYILTTKGSKKDVRCFIKGRKGIECGYLSKDYIFNKTKACIPITEDEVAFVKEVEVIAKEKGYIE